MNSPAQQVSLFHVFAWYHVLTRFYKQFLRLQFELFMVRYFIWQTNSYKILIFWSHRDPEVRRAFSNNDVKCFNYRKAAVTGYGYISWLMFSKRWNTFGSQGQFGLFLALLYNRKGNCSNSKAKLTAIKVWEYRYIFSPHPSTKEGWSTSWVRTACKYPHPSQHTSLRKKKKRKSFHSLPRRMLRPLLSPWHWYYHLNREN